VCGEAWRLRSSHPPFLLYAYAASTPRKHGRVEKMVGKRVRGFYTDGNGKVRPISGRRGRRVKTLFFPPKSRKYAEIVRIDSPDAARVSVKRLEAEFHSAETREKKRRVKKMMVLAANRAAASARKSSLSGRERGEFREVEAVYRNSYRGLKI